MYSLRLLQIARSVKSIAKISRYLLFFQHMDEKLFMFLVEKKLLAIFEISITGFH